MNNFVSYLKNHYQFDVFDPKNLNISVFLKRYMLKKKKMPGKPVESSPSLFLQKIDKSEFSSINLTFYPTHIDATDHIYPMGPPKPHF